MPTTGRARSEQELKQALAEALAGARRRTLDLVAPLSRADLVGQHSTIMSPLVWDVAHIGYFEELWLARHVGGDAPLLEDGDDLYDAFEHERSARFAAYLQRQRGDEHDVALTRAGAPARRGHAGQRLPELGRIEPRLALGETRRALQRGRDQPAIRPARERRGFLRRRGCGRGAEFAALRQQPAFAAPHQLIGG